MRGLSVDSRRAWMPQACTPKEGVERCLYRVEGYSRALPSLTQNIGEIILKCMQRFMAISQFMLNLEKLSLVAMHRMAAPFPHKGKF